MEKKPRQMFYDFAHSKYSTRVDHGRRLSYLATPRGSSQVGVLPLPEPVGTGPVRPVPGPTGPARFDRFPVLPVRPGSKIDREPVPNRT
jgi:hypothetical protein